MNPNKALWEKGDFTRLARTMRASGERFAGSLGIAPGTKVLDLGCGDGTTALPAAVLGADVLGVDIASNLVAAGTARARAAGLVNLRFQEGDACDLRPLPDAAFDLVVSVFGAMFAPKPFDVAREMVRVTTPGGRIVMGNWIPNDPTLVAQILKISAAYAAPPARGLRQPDDLGRREPRPRALRRRRRGPGRGVVRTGHVHLRIRRHAGRFRGRIQALVRADDDRVRGAERNGRSAALQAELEALFDSQNRSTAAGHTTVDVAFLRVTVAVG